MTANGVLQLALYVIVLVALAKPLGAYMARVYENRPCGLDGALGWLERLIYRLAGVRPDQEMGWKTYAATMLLFNLLGALVVYALQRLQGVLPLNPQGLGAVSPDSSFNTAVSFATNTNWQGYGGESTMSYLSQMVGLTAQNFLSAAVGMAVLIALIRGFARRSAQTIGNFWVDLTRTTLYILLPLSFVVALILVSQGVVQTLGEYPKVAILQSTQYDEPVTDKDGKPVLDEKGLPKTKTSTLTEQVIAVGPAASQIAIKQLGTNGGGFFNVNSSHPFENPTPLANFVELLSILMLSGALCYTFGVMVRDTRQGWAILAAMTVIFVVMLGVCYVGEQRGAVFARQGVDHTASALQPGGNMEGKETRFGIASSALWATATTVASNGSVNSMHDSYTPIGGLVPMWMIQLGEVVYGGVGSGLYGMLDLRHHRSVRRRAHGRSDAGVSGQEDRGVRDENVLAGDLDHSGTGADRDVNRGGHGSGQGRHGQPRSARVQRSALRILLGVEQQRQRVRWPLGQHALLQHGARYRDAVRPVLAGGARPGHRGCAGPEEDCPGGCRDAAHSHSALRRAPDRRGHPRGRPDVRSGAGTRSHRRASQPDRGEVRVRGNNRPLRVRLFPRTEITPWLPRQSKRARCSNPGSSGRRSSTRSAS